MNGTLNDIAKELKNKNKNCQLIYAFNGTGKTRLSKEFKNLISSNNDEYDDFSGYKILYYNAFTEDLFYWDNDLDGDINPKLKIQPNSFTDWILREEGAEGDIIDHFNNYSGNKLEPRFNEDYSEVSFRFCRGNNEQNKNIKISKGEESFFIWGIFYTFLQHVIEELNNTNSDQNKFSQLEYIFIDDPVTSLDENHLIELAVNLAQLIKDAPEKFKFIISTHNPLFSNVIYNELDLKCFYLLQKHENEYYTLTEKKGSSNTCMSYHLHIKEIIKDAIDNDKVERFHFNLLRNLYEKTAAFLGYPKWGELLPKNNREYEKRIMNTYSHNTLSNEYITMPTVCEKETIKIVFEHLLKTYNFNPDRNKND